MAVRLVLDIQILNSKLKSTDFKCLCFFSYLFTGGILKPEPAILY